MWCADCGPVAGLWRWASNTMRVSKCSSSNALTLWRVVLSRSLREINSLAYQTSFLWPASAFNSSSNLARFALTSSWPSCLRASQLWFIRDFGFLSGGRGQSWVDRSWGLFRGRLVMILTIQVLIFRIRPEFESQGIFRRVSAGFRSLVIFRPASVNFFFYFSGLLFPPCFERAVKDRIFIGQAGRSEVEREVVVRALRARAGRRHFFEAVKESAL